MLRGGWDSEWLIPDSHDEEAHIPVRDMNHAAHSTQEAFGTKEKRDGLGLG